MLGSVKGDAPEVIAPEHVASVAVGEKATNSHPVLFGRAAARGKYVCRHYFGRLLQMFSDHV